jgi:hypothetical protein
MKRISLFSAAVCLTFLAIGVAPARAGVAPNPGGTSVTTNSTTSSYVDQLTPVTQTVNQYSTTIDATLNGGASVYDQTFALSFSDPVVQAALGTAEAILTADNATFGLPVLASSSTAQLSSVTANVVQPGPYTHATGNTTVTEVNTFGPATIMVGDNQVDTFTVLAGQLDENINTNNEYFIPVNVVTTNTDLTTQSYLLNGTTAVQGVPDSGSSLLLLGMGLAVLGCAARWRTLPATVGAR